MGSLISEIQKNCIDPNVSTLDILRKLKVAAVKLDLNDVLDWINNELGGYYLTFEELPKPRQARGDPRYQNPINGWQPLRTGKSDDDGKLAEKLSQVPVRQSIAELEGLVLCDNDTELVFRYPPDREAAITKLMEFQYPIGVFISPYEIKGVIEDVRNQCLDLALELEKRGIMGENMAFTNDDKSKASNVTLNVTAGSIGSLSNVSDNGLVNNNNTVTNFTGSPEQISEIVDRIRGSIEGLPKENRQQISDLTTQLDNEKDDPEKSAITIRSIRTVCEAAAGNLTAQGIINLLSSL